MGRGRRRTRGVAGGVRLPLSTALHYQASSPRGSTLSTMGTQFSRARCSFESRFPASVCPFVDLSILPLVRAPLSLPPPRRLTRARSFISLSHARARARALFCILFARPAPPINPPRNERSPSAPCVRLSIDERADRVKRVSTRPPLISRLQLPLAELNGDQRSLESP